MVHFVDMSKTIITLCINDPKMFGLETDFESTRPIPHHVETKNIRLSSRPRPRPQKIGLETYIPGSYQLHLSPIHIFIDSNYYSQFDRFLLFLAVICMVKKMLTLGWNVNSLLLHRIHDLLRSDRKILPQIRKNSHDICCLFFSIEYIFWLFALGTN